MGLIAKGECWVVWFGQGWCVNAARGLHGPPGAGRTCYVADVLTVHMDGQTWENWGTFRCPPPLVSTLPGCFLAGIIRPVRDKYSWPEFRSCFCILRSILGQLWACLSTSSAALSIVFVAILAIRQSPGYVKVAAVERWSGAVGSPPHSAHGR